jgi:hypothetical protein
MGLPVIIAVLKNIPFVLHLVHVLVLDAPWYIALFLQGQVVEIEVFP